MAKTGERAKRRAALEAAELREAGCIDAAARHLVAANATRKRAKHPERYPASSEPLIPDEDEYWNIYTGR